MRAARIVATTLGLALLLAACSSSGPGSGSGSNGPDAPDDDVVAGSVLVLPGEPTAAVRSVALTRRYDRDLSTTVYEIVRLDGVGDTPVWRTPPLGTDAYRVPLATDGTHVLTAIDAKVYAFDLGSGRPVWEAPLSDVFQAGCDRCFEVVGQRLLVRSFDSVIHAIDTTTGTEVWSRRLESVSGGMQVAGSRLLVIDGSYPGPTAEVVDPATGATVAALATGCHEDGSIIPPRTIDADATVLTGSTEPDAAYLGYGYVPACWQKWDLADGSLVWDTVLPDDYLDHGTTAVLDEPRLTFGTRNPSLVQLDTVTGAGAAVPLPPDTDITPIATEGSSIIAQAVTTRGTAKWSMVGLDATTGAVRWQVPLGTATPLDADHPGTTISSAEQRFTTHVSGGKVDIVTIDGATGQLSTQRIDLADGTPSPVTTVPYGTDGPSISFAPVAWSGSTAVLVVDDRLVVLDTTTSTVTWSY